MTKTTAQFATIPLALMLFSATGQGAENDLPVCETNPPPVQGNVNWVTFDNRPDQFDRSCETKITVDPTPGSPNHAYLVAEFTTDITDVDLSFRLDARQISLAGDDEWTFLALNFADATLTLSITKATSAGVGNSGWNVESAWVVDGAPTQTQTQAFDSLFEQVSMSWTENVGGRALIEVSLGDQPFQDLGIRHFGDPNAVAWGLINDLDDPVAGSEVILDDFTGTFEEF